jgi:predicted acetyltransferase
MTAPAPAAADEPTFRLRRGTADDARLAFDIFLPAIRDLADRLNSPWEVEPEAQWSKMAYLFDHLAAHAAEWWIAEDADGGQPIGYARSIERGGLFELSEFFVLPGRQASGVGRQLLERAFPMERGTVRAIIATTDARAVARYHRADTSIQFPILGLNGRPAADAADSIGLGAEPIDEADLDAVADVERAVLGHERGEHELRWLLRRREGWLYRAGGGTIGFAFVGRDGTGPVAATEPGLIGNILAHVEARAAALGLEELGFEVPAPNVAAIRHLLARGYRFDPFVTYLMANRPFGQFDRFIGFSPPFVL